MENVELGRMLEVVAKEKRHMHLQLQHVLEEQVGESSTTKETNNSSTSGKEDTDIVPKATFKAE